jgi:CHAT domain-containing protein
MPLKNWYTFLLIFSVSWVILAIYISITAQNELKLARTYATQSSQLYDKGEFQKALPFAEKAFKMRLKRFGISNIDTLTSLNDLAATYQKLGRLSEALPLLEKNYRLMQEVPGAKHHDTLRSLNNLAGIYQDLGRLSEALPLYEKNYRLSQEVLGAKHLHTLKSLNNLAIIYQNLGRLSEALPLFEKGYRLRKEVLGAKHPDTLISLNDLAIIYRHLGRLSEALPLFEKGYRFYQEVLGAKHPYTLISLTNLAYAEAEFGAIDKAIKHLEQSIEVVEALRQTGDLSTENRQALFATWVPCYFCLSKFYIFGKRPNEAFHTAEKAKARTLLESMTIKLAVQKAGLTQDEQQQFYDYRTKIADLTQQKARTDNQEQKLILEMDKNELVRQAAKFHRTLLQKYPKYAQLNDFQMVDAETGASLIPKNAIFISYLVNKYHEVIVFTLDTTGQLQADFLGEIPHLDKTLKTYRELLGSKCTVPELRGECGGGQYVLKMDDGSFVITDGLTKDDRIKRRKINNIEEISRYLAQQLLAPIKTHLQGKQRLIISPDSELALIPFETLILKDKPLIATHSVSYVQSLSVLALLKKRETTYQAIKNRGTLLAMGAAQYELPDQSIARKNCNKARNTPAIDLETLLWRNANDPQRDLRAFKALDIPWCNLPGTETELTNVKELFTDALIFKNKQATEAQLQRLNADGTLTRYRYILLSAHGYLSTEVPALSAIVLDPHTKTNNTDGYITASEWPSYNLQSDLMVLSACQTGVGKVMRGEGVMGLPYAFYVAGNKNTLLTLWSVLDDSTAEFTTRFFKKLKNGQGQIEALTATKREFLASEKYKRPLYWGAFVMYGI